VSFESNAGLSRERKRYGGVGNALMGLLQSDLLMLFRFGLKTKEADLLPRIYLEISVFRVPKNRCDSSSDSVLGSCSFSMEPS
jgi:hypothetical protein